MNFIPIVDEIEEYFSPYLTTNIWKTTIFQIFIEQLVFYF